ncbi:MAG: tripartite tricarboxylate transporter substrate binding protein [Burkholderiales bacterium]|nr:tripartite tricarboxylate transporter substrate binding protein [Burkholderiales bacterium]
MNVSTLVTRGMALALWLGCAHAQAQAGFPARPITLSVGFAPGGGTDITARLLAKKLSEQLGQPVNVENKPGAGGNLAAELATRAAADGHFIHLSAIGPLTVAPHITRKLGYDPRRDFVPLSMAVAFPNVLVVGAAQPYRSLDDYVRAARSRPGAIAYGSSGIGGTGHLSGALLESFARADLTHVPYKGGGPAMTDLLGGQVPSVFASAASALPQIKAGKIRALAVTGAKRSDALPEVPSIAETYPGYDVSNWYAFVAPPRLPRDLAERWNREIVRALSDPQVREQIRDHGMDAVPSPARELAERIERELVLWEKIVKQAGITAD